MSQGLSASAGPGSWRWLVSDHLLTGRQTKRVGQAGHLYIYIYIYIKNRRGPNTDTFGAPEGHVLTQKGHHIF